MKLKKIFAGLMASAMALSTMALVSSADQLAPDAIMFLRLADTEFVVNAVELLTAQQQTEGVIRQLTLLKLVTEHTHLRLILLTVFLM